MRCLYGTFSNERADLRQSQDEGLYQFCTLYKGQARLKSEKRGKLTYAQHAASLQAVEPHGLARLQTPWSLTILTNLSSLEKPHRNVGRHHLHHT